MTTSIWAIRALSASRLRPASNVHAQGGQAPCTFIRIATHAVVRGPIIDVMKQLAITNVTYWAGSGLAGLNKSHRESGLNDISPLNVEYR